MSKEHFRISSELKNVIGQDLITDDFVAIFELVKNSFDAKASQVHVVFDLKPDNSSIHIIDDGKGMSLKDIREKWFFLGYSAKKEGTEDGSDSHSRHYAGNKGVGRFSCDRLGRKLHLEAKARSGDVNVVDIDWRAFEKSAKKEFGSIEAELSGQKEFSGIANYSGFLPKEQGVVLSVFQLREPESWTYEKLQKLKRALSKLLDPFDGQMSNRRIFIHADSYAEEDAKESERAQMKNEEPFTVNGLVGNPLYEVLKSKTTSLHAFIENGKMTVRLEDRGTFIYETEESVSLDFPLLSNISFDASIAYLNQSAKATFSRRMGITPISYGSMFLVKNGFRIYPIGEENNDFWGIDHRKQQGYNRYLGSRELLGRIKIVSDDNTMFKESSSRDKGLIETPALFQLRECTIYLIRKLEAFVTGVSWNDKADKTEDTAKRLHLDANKARLIKLVTRLALNKDITIIHFNRDLVSLLDKRSEGYEDALVDLKTIALQQKDKVLLASVEKAASRLEQAKKEVEEANRIAQAEQDARIRAESDAAKSRALARKADDNRKKTENELDEEKKRSIFLSASVGQDKEVLFGFLHQITLCSTAARMELEEALIEFGDRAPSVEDIRERLTDIMEWVEKIATLAKFSTKANFRYDSTPRKEDLPLFAEQYIQKVAPAYESVIALHGRLDFHFKCSFNPLEMGIVFDNLISNSKKAHASNLTFESKEDKHSYMLLVADDGDGLTGDADRIFENGYTRTNGSGIGLYFCKKLLEKVHADIIVSPVQPKKGASFSLVFKK